jgi:hypothetical protein
MVTIPFFPPTTGFAKFLVSELPQYMSREQGIVSSGSGKLLSGTILGKRTRGTAAPTSAAIAGNTGNGTLAFTGGAGTGVDAGAASGTYQVRFVGATDFVVYKPNGQEEGRGSTGVAYNGAVNFTITAGGTAFVAGDAFNIVAAWNAGTQEFTPVVEGATDGSADAVAILLEDIDTTDADVVAAFIVRVASVQRAALEFVGTPSNGFKDACYAALAAQQISFR